MRRTRLTLLAAVLTAAVVPLASPPAAAQPCEGIDCVTDPANAVVCVAQNAKQIKSKLSDCLTQTT